MVHLYFKKIKDRSNGEKICERRRRSFTGLNSGRDHDRECRYTLCSLLRHFSISIIVYFGGTEKQHKIDFDMTVEDGGEKNHVRCLIFSIQ